MYTFFISSWRVLEYLGQAQPIPIERRRAKIARYQNLKNVKKKANSSRLSLMSDSERFSCQYFFCKAVLNKMIKTYSHIYQSNNLYFETYRFNSDVLQAVNERETKFIFSPDGKSVKISLTLLWRKYFQFKDAGFHFNILFVISLYTYSYSKWNSELSRINVHSDSALLQSFHARCFRVIVLIILNNIFKKNYTLFWLVLNKMCLWNTMPQHGVMPRTQGQCQGHVFGNEVICKFLTQKYG